MCVCFVTQSCPTFGTLWTCSPLGSSVHRILQARILQVILEWAAIPFSRGSSWPRNWTCISCIAGRFFTIWATREDPIFFLRGGMLLWWLRWWGIFLLCRRPEFDPWVEKIPWRREWLPTLIFLPGKLRGQRNLVGYSVGGPKELDTTEKLTLSHFNMFIIYLYFLVIYLLVSLNHFSIMVFLLNTDLLKFIWSVVDTVILCKFQVYNTVSHNF